MVYKRKRSFRGKRKFKRAFKRRYFRRASRRGQSSNVHLYKRWGTAYTEVLSAATQATFGYHFSLNQVKAYSELTALYDQYKICAVVMKFQLINNPDTTNQPGQNPANSQINPTYYPKMWYYRDYDDNTAPLNLDAIREVGKAKCVVLRPNSMISVKVKPAVASQLYRTAVTTGYQAVWPKKVDCTQDDVPHYGLKWAIDANNITPYSTGQFAVRVETLYYLKMMNSR